MSPRMPAFTWAFWMATVVSKSTEKAATRRYEIRMSSGQPADRAQRWNPQKNSQYWKKMNRKSPTSSLSREKGTVRSPARGLYLKKSSPGWGA